ncbi:MAG: hypothetical protein ACRECP_12170 [Methylocella sp.]
MIKIASLPAIAGALLACALSVAPAEAQASRTFVSGKGVDSGTCAYAAPCRSFGFALTQTNAFGEIDVLDPAGYGAVTINKSISIVNDGVGTAGIKAASGNAVTISGGAAVSVHLRGLTIEGLGSGNTGIQFDTGGSLAVENCVIRDFFIGINIAPTGSAAITGVLSNVITDNNNNGILVNGTASTGASVNVTVVDSVASNNNTGISAVSATGKAVTQITVRNSVASYSGTGLLATSAILRVAHSVVTGNTVGVNVASGGTLFSYGDNDIDGNINANTGVLTPLAMH